MAHADYECCAVCDTKMTYHGFDAPTKERICPDCMRCLGTAGLHVFTGEEVAAAIVTDPERVVPILEACGFKTCFYGNPVDDAWAGHCEAVPS